MNYSFMSFSEPKLSLKELIIKAETLGYNAIEPRVESSHMHGIELGMSKSLINETNKMIFDSSVKLGCLATGICIANENSNKQEENLKAYINLCNELNIKALRVFGGDFGDISREEAVNRAAKVVNNVLKNIGETDVTVCFETHDFWCVPEDVLSVIKAVNDESFAANWDIMHPVITSKTPCSMKHAFEVLKNHIKHVHIHDGKFVNGKLKFERIGNGNVDHKTAIACLKSINYSGCISGEWINFDDENHLESEIKTLRKIEEEV